MSHGPSSNRTGSGLATALMATALLVTALACLVAFPGAASADHPELDGAIEPIPEQQFTFTDATGMIPFTVENNLDRPLAVVVAFESPKLEFPEGSAQHVTLPPGPTTLEVAVESRATGSFPLHLRVLSADGTTELTSTRFTVRSTAISGIGLALALGAGVFLLMWWAKHFHNVRRAKRLISPNHPTLRREGRPGGEP